MRGSKGLEEERGWALWEMSSQMGQECIMEGVYQGSRRRIVRCGGREGRLEGRTGEEWGGPEEVRIYVQPSITAQTLWCGPLLRFCQCLLTSSLTSCSPPSQKSQKDLCYIHI